MDYGEIFALGMAIGSIITLILYDAIFGSKVELDCQPNDMERIKAARSATVSIEEELHL